MVRCVTEQVDGRAVDHPPLAAVVEGLWHGIRLGDPLAGAQSGRVTPTGTRQMSLRSVTVTLNPLVFVGLVPVGEARPSQARASASPDLMPYFNPSTRASGLDEVTLHLVQRVLACTTVYPLPRSQYGAVIINKV